MNDRMYSYVAFGMSIASELPLPELMPAVEGPPDLVIQVREIDPARLGLLDRRTHLLSLVRGVGRFLCIEGKEIHVSPFDGVSSAELRVTLLGPVMTLLLRQRAINVIHGSSVAIDGEAVVFVGPCGAGKSTMAQILHNAGYTILSDDVTAIRHQDGAFHVAGGYPQIKLNEDSAVALVPESRRLSPLYEGASKQALYPRDRFSTEWYPLSHVFVLRIGDSTAFDRVSEKEAFLALMHNSRIGYLADFPEYAQRRFFQCTELAREIPVSMFWRHREFDSALDLVPELLAYLYTSQDSATARIPDTQMADGTVL